MVEEYTFTAKLRGEPYNVDEWDSPEWPFTSAVNDTPDALYRMWDEAVARSRERLAAALADGGLGQDAHVSGPDGQHASLRRLVFDLVEEYGRHTGHADLIRESIDGRVGEDPPPGWRPTS